MAVQNSIAKATLVKEAITEYKCGEELVRLSPSIVRSYLVNGNGNVTDQEVSMFVNLCKYQHLNPFLREAYLIKFGSQPATIVTGKEAMTKRAMRNPNYEGQQAGIVLYNEETGELEYRMGSIALNGEKLVGGWAKVYVKGYQVPIEVSVAIREYIGRKSDGTVNQQWSNKPATMIRKVALMQALREAFPEDLGGMYDVSEVGVDFDESASQMPVEAPQIVSEGEPEPEQHSMEELHDF